MNTKKALIVGASAVVGAAAAGVAAKVIYDKVTAPTGELCEGECPCLGDACCDGGGDAEDTDADGPADGEMYICGGPEEPTVGGDPVPPSAGVLPGGSIFTPTQIVPDR